MVEVWVITREDTQNVVEVVGLLSGRKSSKFIKQYVEQLYALLYSSPQSHLAMARDTSVAYEAEFDQTNTGAKVDDLLRCGGRRYLVASRAKNVELDETGDVVILKWEDPDQLICDPATALPVERRKRPARQAPVRLPLLSNDG